MVENTTYELFRDEELSDRALDELQWGRACYCWANARSDHRTTGGGE